VKNRDYIFHRVRSQVKPYEHQAWESIMDNCRSISRRVALATTAVALAAASFPAHAQVKSVVLVHGAFADGSGWKPVADILQSHGYAVRVVQEPETSFAADVAATRRVLDKAGLVCWSATVMAG
jgi:pimeloyl-ACP methyl ester carboxylesterase